MTTLLQRMGLAVRAGLQFADNRDLYAIFGWRTELKFEDYLAKYSRQDVAARIIDAPPQATWRSPPVIETAGPFKEQWEKLTREHQVWNRLERADRLAGLGTFAILLIGLDDGADLESPVSGGEHKLTYMQPYSEGSASVTLFEDDVRNPRYGMPTEYEVQAFDTKGIQTGATTRPMSTKRMKVHHTRVLHVADSPLEDNTFGVPRLSRIFNVLDDLLKVSGGSAETFWLTANRGLHIDIDKDMELNSTDADNLSDEIDEYQHQLRRAVRTRGAKVKVLGSDTPDPSGTFKMLINMLSGATGIPQRILIGSEAGQLASEQDRANWAERVNERNNSFAEPKMLAPLVRLLMDAGVLPEEEDPVWVWPDAFKMDPLETAQMMAQQARAAVNFSRQGQFGQPITTQEEARVIMLLPEEGGPEQLELEDTKPGIEADKAKNPDETTDEDDPDFPGNRQEDEAQQPRGNVRSLAHGSGSSS